MRVSSIMDCGYPSIYVDELATKARAVLRECALRILPVVDENKQLIGVVSRRDIMIITSSISAIRVKGIMSTPRFTATTEMDAFQAAREMVRLDEWYVPVVKSSQDRAYEGMLGLENFIAAFLNGNSVKLSEPLSTIMSTNIITCSFEDEIDNVWRLMQKKSFTGLPVVKKNKLVGVVTQKDLLDSGAVFPVFEAKKGRFKAPSKVSSVMKTPAISLQSTDTIKEAAELMLRKNFGRIPIVDGKDKLIGIVDREDIVNVFL
ncbi:MAG: CBS domain-containing protein [Thermoproteota archaeon]|nr:CBS domain-containing protein [Thermoproteota archaeon]